MGFSFIVLVIVAILLFQQRTKIGVLEAAVKRLTEEQLRLIRQLELLKKGLLKPEDKLQQAASLEVVAPPHTDKTPTPFAQPSPSGKPELPDLALPDLELPDVKSVAPLAVSSAAANPAVPRVATPASVQPEAVAESKIAAALRRFFSEGNPIVRIGMVVMFFGVSFLVKYASGQGFFPIELRLSAVLLGAIALLAFGWKTRARAGAYGLVLQGGGIAVIYLTLFAAAKIYGLIPLGIAFALLFLLVMLGAVLALLQNAQVLAILATAGGFLAPILTSTGEGSHVGLFSFYLILNIGILTIAVYKAWRLLNWVGFMFTFVITAAWGALNYEPIFYASTQPFLIAFFALYLVVSVLFSFKQPANLKGMVDGSLVFGLPLIAFGLQTTLLRHSEQGMAISAVVLAAIYLALAAGLGRRYKATQRVLIESFLALGICFATLAVPLALDASWTSVTWALEATGLVWVGLRQQRLRARVTGYVLHIAAAVSLVLVGGLQTGVTPIVSGDFIGILLLSLTSFTIAYLLHSYASACHSAEPPVAIVAIMCGVLWFFVAGISEILAHIQADNKFASIIVFASLAAATCMWVGKKIAWSELGQSVYGLLPFVVLLSVSEFADGDYVHPAHGLGLLAILVFFAVQYRFLFNRETEQQGSAAIDRHLLRGWHIGSAWLLFALIFWEVSWQQQSLSLHGTASLMLWFAALVIPAAVVMAAAQKKCWPFINFAQEYKNLIPAPLLVLSVLWFFAVCPQTLSSGDRYLPLLNALDTAQFAVILLLAYVVKYEFMTAVNFISRNTRIGFLGAMLFIWINVVCLRAISRYQAIDYNFTSLWDAVQVQMTLSILWALCALLLMNLARRHQRREWWMIGATLLAVIVLKLFTVDLTGSGTLARIVSFLVVGGLMLLIGLISPIPVKPKAKDLVLEEADSQQGVTLNK